MAVEKLAPSKYDFVRSALVADALDALGFRNQALGWDIRSLSTGGLVQGRAFTAIAETVDAVPATPYVGLLKALDQVQRGEIFVFSTGRDDRAAVWGELLTTVCAVRGVAGVMTDGLVRDLASIRNMDFPVFGRGTLPTDINGRLEVTASQFPVVVDEVEISPGDWIVADLDGVLVVPASVELDVLQIVHEKSIGESAFRDAVASGELPSVAFSKYGVL